MNNTRQTPRSSAELAFRRTMEFEYGVAAEVAPGVRRMVARNPGPFTFKGTNTYIIGRGEVAVIDPGPGPEDPDHLPALLRELKGERISHILITHTHRDHTDGIEALREHTDAPLMAYGPTGKPRGVRTSSPSGKAFVEEDFKPDRNLRQGDTVKGDGWALDVMHTPGHAPDHLCFALVGRRTVLSGDHVMGWNTTVVAPPEGHMGDYMASLKLLMERNDRMFLPGHGERIEMPRRATKALMMHRQWRETAVLDCVQEGLEFVPQIVARIYAGLAPELHGAAGMSVLAHLEHLIDRGLVASDRPAALDASYAAL